MKTTKKIILDTQEDLINLPVEVIKNTKIYNYSGKYYDELYKRALDIEAGKEVKKPIKAEDFTSISDVLDPIEKFLAENNLI